MIIRNTTQNGDFTFGKGQSDYLRDQSAILQNIKTRLLSWLGDCFYAQAEGVDYNNLLSTGTKTLLDSDIKRIILQSEGVVKINDFKSELSSDRNYSGEATITTIYQTDKLIF